MQRAVDTPFIVPVGLALADPHVAERFRLLEDGRSVLEMWMG